MNANDYKLRKGLVKILENMFIKAKDVLYTVPFEDTVCFEIKRKNKKLRYHLKLEVLPFSNTGPDPKRKIDDAESDSV